MKYSPLLLFAPMSSCEDNRKEEAESGQEDRLQQHPEITIEERDHYPQREEECKRKQKCCDAAEAPEIFNDRRSHKRCRVMNSYILTSRQPTRQKLT
jgi:hypothetical protein